MNNQQKKLLLLGGLRYLIPVIKAAHEQGYYVITCDYKPDNPAHQYSDEFHNISILEKEKVLQLAKELKIDGIMSFAVDPGVVTASYVAEKMNLPFNGSYESVKIMQNKALFRDFLTKNDFKVPKAKGYFKMEDALQDVNFFLWPVMVKPVDSAGSKGVSKVNSPDELKDKIEYALSFSNSKEFIIEEFIAKKGYSSDADSFSYNGKLLVCTFSDQRFDENSPNPYTPSAYSWPSTQSSESLQELRSELQRLIDLLSLKTGVYNIEVREDNKGNAYIMEMSPRGGGNRLSEMLRFAANIDLIKNAVRAAVGDSVEPLSDPIYDGFWAIIILNSSKKGIFKGLEISDKLKKNIIEKDLWIKRGETVNAFTGANEAIGTLILRFPSRQELEEILCNQDQFINVILNN